MCHFKPARIKATLEGGFLPQCCRNVRQLPGEEFEIQ
jgi:hypothetical protein